jgi:hypothetical protein
MRSRFDWLAKQIGENAFNRAGRAFIQHEISPETQYADLRIETDPTRDAERKRLGLLGQLGAVPSLVETYSHAPSAQEFRGCMGTHIADWQARERKARAHEDHTEDPARGGLIEPHLWIISAGRPSSLLRSLELKQATDWPTGIYLFGAHVRSLP